jgi:very-short-patch-repair endonuclease
VDVGHDRNAHPSSLPRRGANRAVARPYPSMTAEPDFGPAMWDPAQVRERRLADLAYRQHGVVALWQLRPLGFDKRWVHRRVLAGRLHPIFPGVYAVGHRRLTWRGRYAAAVLACGPDAVLSHVSAAILHGILRYRSGAIHVTTPATGRAKRRAIKLHEARQAARYAVTVDGIPVTSLAHTLLDLAASESGQVVARAIEESERNGLFDLGAVDRVLAENKGARGAKRLKVALIEYRPAPDWTRSDFEDEYFRQARMAGLPVAAVNNWVAGHEVDCVYYEQKLVIELDGGNYHHTTAARERDPQRDIHLQLAGYDVMRVTDKRLARDPKGVMADVRRMLDRPV